MASRASSEDPAIDRHGEARICIDHGFIPGQALLNGRIILKAWDEYGSPMSPAEFLARCRRVLRARSREYPDSGLAEKFARSRALAREASLRARSLPIAAFCRPALRFVRARRRVGVGVRRARRRPAALARDGDGDPPGPEPTAEALATPVALLSEGGAP